MKKERKPFEPRKPQQVQLSEDHKRLRIIAFVAVLALALTAFAFGIYYIVHKDPGWREVTVKDQAMDTCAGSFHFQYKMGSGGAAEYKKVQQVYTDDCVYMEAVFSLESSAMVPGNLYSVDQAPNQTVEVDPVLYQALAKMQEVGSRALYLAPVYAYYENLFQCSEDWETESFDPYQNAEVAEDVANICAFIQDPEMIDIELLGENKVCLKVAEEYQTYAEENEIVHFIDFYWMKNAFILDHLADTLIQEGFTSGYITSVDGFSASLGDCGELYTTQVYDLAEDGVYAAAVLQYGEARRVAALHDYTTTETLGDYFYTFEDGTVRTPYIDPEDGLCKSSMHDLLVYGDSCQDILLQAFPVFIGASDDMTALEGVIYCKDRVIYHKENAELSQIFSNDELQYQEEIIP